MWPLGFIFSALLAAAGYWLVRRFAPEAGGSGIPEIEGALEELRPVRWWRVIPVKFIGGLGTLGAGMVLGREGPTVQVGLSQCHWQWPEIIALVFCCLFSFPASVRAPLTGIVLVLEMTDNYQLILPMIITCLGATLLAQMPGGKPLYSSILARTLEKQQAANSYTSV